MKSFISNLTMVMEMVFAFIGSLFAIVGGIWFVFHYGTFDFLYLVSLFKTGLGIFITGATGLLVYRAFWKGVEADMHFLAAAGSMVGIVFGLMFALDKTLVFRYFGASELVRAISAYIAISGTYTLLMIITQVKCKVAPQTQG